jgi:hypothetical protein
MHGRILSPARMVLYTRLPYIVDSRPAPTVVRRGFELSALRSRPSAGAWPAFRPVQSIGCMPSHPGGGVSRKPIEPTRLGIPPR